MWIVEFDSSEQVTKAPLVIQSGSPGFTTLSSNDEFGVRLANLGDWDGDGAPELGVGAYLDDDGGADNGAVYSARRSTQRTIDGVEHEAGLARRLF